MKNMSITSRLVFLAITAIISLFIVGAVGLASAVKGRDGVRHIRDDSLVSVKILGETRNYFQQMRVFLYAYLLEKDPEEKIKFKQSIDEHLAKFDESFKSYEKTISTDEDRKLYEQDKALIDKYKGFLNDEFFVVSTGWDTYKAQEVLRLKLRPLAREISDQLQKHVDYNNKMADTYAEEVNTSVTVAIEVIAASIVTALIIVLVLSYFIITNIRKSLEMIRNDVMKIDSELDFATRITILRKDEIGQTAIALNHLLDTMSRNLLTILDKTTTVTFSASQMAKSSDEVAIAAHQQSESAANMAATIEEMTVSITHVGDRAHEADQISAKSGMLADSGEKIIVKTSSDINKVAGTVNEAANKINSLVDSAKKISGVVAVIKEVAEQTNLLALNAAIEAARAGDQGRGFAVVADEVRALAERTATSTKEISSTIKLMQEAALEVAGNMSHIVDEVNLCVESADQANQAIQQIGVGSRNAVEIVQEISSAIREQASAMTDIARQVEKIAQMSEESSASADSSAGIAKRVDSLALEMQQVVHQYKL